MNASTGITGSAHTGLSGRGAFFSLVGLAVLFFAIPMFYKRWEKKMETKTVAAQPVVRILKCDSGDDSEYPWIGYEVSTLVVPPSDCWTEWQGIGEDGDFSRKFNLVRSGQVERRYRYGDGRVGPILGADPFSDIEVGFPTAVQFRNSGKKEVKIRATVR